MRRVSFLFPLFALLVLSGCGINAIPTDKQRVDAAWSQVLNEYQRRADLIPNLVATVKGYAHHETKVLTEVTNARARVTQTRIPANILTNPKAFHEFERNQATLGGALSRLMAVTENYPNLKANQNFLTLQAQIEGTENRIAVARRDYILAVRRYNTELVTYPGRWWHHLLYQRYRVMQNFTISRQAMSVPKVHF
ncbi:MAG: LemA family protein [Acidiferrobacteraceae bacterium]